MPVFFFFSNIVENIKMGDEKKTMKFYDIFGQSLIIKLFLNEFRIGFSVANSIDLLSTNTAKSSE